jgi:23S rRNA pseudouridine2605 synthase
VQTFFIMARNERRNSGSGRSRNERSDSKRTPGKKRTEAPGKREGARSGPDRNKAFSRRQDNREDRPAPARFERSGGNKFSKPKPFTKRRDERGERDDAQPRPERKRPFAKRGDFGENPRAQFSRNKGPDDKKPFSKKRDFRSGKDPRNADDARGERPRNRTFQRSDFTRGDRDEKFSSKPRIKSNRDESAPRPFSPRKGKDTREDSSDHSAKKPFKKERPERKSFIESRLEKQRQPKRAVGDAPAKEDGLIRLNKFISNSGVCSRREADNLISMGLVSVNGTTITEMGYKVKATDDVRYEGKRLKAEKPVYILLNKPKGFITTTEDPQERHTVMNLIANACSERVYPVGRLDRNTTGLLLLTNDGDLADKLTHPSYNVKKIYKVELDKPITKADFDQLAAGIRLEEGLAVPDDVAIVSDDRITVGIELHIGWNRIVRRLFESLGYDVVKLDRVVYAGLDKKDLPRGNWRFLTQQEIVRLKHYK